MLCGMVEPGSAAALLRPWEGAEDAGHGGQRSGVHQEPGGNKEG